MKTIFLLLIFFLNMENLIIDDEMPSPELSPKEVIEIQLKALQHNNVQNRGIATTFNFASPGNKAFTGPLDRFILLVKNPVYAPMLNFKSYRSSQVVVKDEEAQQIVILKTQDGEEAAYLFKLSKQSQAPYQNCWMTDSVIRLEMKDENIKKI